MALDVKLGKNEVAVLLVPRAQIDSKLESYNELLKDPNVSITSAEKAGMDNMTFAQHIDDLASSMKAAGSKGIILCAKEDVKEGLKGDIKLFVDRVMEAK